jgi:hypothetical protein
VQKKIRRVALAVRPVRRFLRSLRYRARLLRRSPVKKRSEIEEEDAEEGGDEDAEDDGEDEHEEEEDDISVLEKLEKASSTPKKPVSKAKAAGGLKRKVLKPKGAPKKKAKGE